jgi:hypothetical protein
MMNGLQILPSYADYFGLTTATTSLNVAVVFLGCIAIPFGGWSKMISISFIPQNFREFTSIKTSELAGLYHALDSLLRNFK